MPDTNELFDDLLAAYRNADDPDRFLREFMMRLDDATANAVVATERKLDRLDAAKARLDAAREIPRPDAPEDGAEPPQAVEEDQEPDDQPDVEEEAEAPPAPKKRRAKKPAPESDTA
jgi:outer membrane biosynthesis protein TonB